MPASTTAADLAAEWTRLAPHLERALVYGGGTHTVADVLDAVARGAMQFWPGERSVLVTEVVTYPRLTAVRVFAGGGDKRELVEMERAVEAWARSIGANRLEGFGRLGWLRALRRLAYTTRVFMWRDLTRDL